MFHFQNTLPAQLVTEHDLVSSADPTQGFPPRDGAGLSQYLDRPWIPIPHVVLHIDQGPQTPQLPFTVIINDQ